VNETANWGTSNVENLRGKTDFLNAKLIAKPVQR